MSVEVVTNFGHLLRLASALGKARKSGDEEKIKAAQEKHDEYKELCLKSYKMSLGAIPEGFF